VVKAAGLKVEQISRPLAAITKRFTKHLKAQKQTFLLQKAKKAGQFIPSCATFSFSRLSLLLNQLQSRFMFSWSKSAAEE